MKALSYKQPWALLVALNIKDVENRTWKCPEKYIGERILIHASAIPVIEKPKKLSDLRPLDCLSKEQLMAVEQTGNTLNIFRLYHTSVIIGSVKIIGCTINHPSIWAEQTEGCLVGNKFIAKEGVKPIYNWILENPILFYEPIPVKGRLSFWDYPNILAEPEERDGELFCHCQLPVKEDSQVMSMGNYQYQCRYCGGKWYK